jgi:predicted ATPase/DNA-binding SARP family transcriptional activator
MQPTPEEAAKTTAAELPTSLARLYVLGQFRLEHRNGQQWQAVKDAVMQHQRVRSLLSCLISNPGRKLGREQVMDMLWPEADFETATHRLDRAVHSLRQLLEPGRSRPATSSLLLTEHQTIQLADQEQLWTDADAFDSLVARARASNDPGQTEQLLEEAMMLYSGDFLPDERSTDWIQTRREGLRRNWIGLLLELADLRTAREALSSATDTLDRLLAVDPTNEAAVQRLIVLLARSGRRGEAIRAYQRFADVLKQEYNIAPLLETRSLYETVQRGEDPAVLLREQGNLEGRPYLSAKGESDQTLSIDQQGEREAPAYAQVGRSHQSPLVGREQELKILYHILRITGQATRIKLAGQKKTSGIAPISLESQRHAQCVLLMGDVGIGKTRLAEETGREAKRHGWAVAWSRAYAQESSVPYHLWTEALRKAMVQGLWQRQEIARRPLIYQSLSTLLPELNDLLSQADIVPVMPPEQEQIRLWEATRSLLTIISESTPLYIVLDDLQWADGSSCELLSYLVRQLRGYPVMIVGTCRDIELPIEHPLRSVLIDLQREQAVEILPIQPLTNEQIRTLLSYLPEPVAHDISARAAGNPFFAEELARSIKAQLIAPTTTASRDAKPQSPTPDTIPELPDTISAVLDLRMGRISNACQRLLTKAAVLGGSFEYHSILAMEMNGPRADEDTILDLLEEALQAGMLTEEGSGTRITYHFWHPILVSHLYDSLSAGRRASLHRRAAEVLRQAYAGREEEGAANIVYHLVNGGAESFQIAHYAELAGDRAYALSAYPEAEQHYRLAVEHLGTLPESASRDERLRMAYLLERLGECTRVQGKDAEARHFYEQALNLRRQQQTFADSTNLEQEAQIQSLLWREIGRTWYNAGNNAQALQCYERGEQVLREAGILAGAAWANLRYRQSYVRWQEGNYDEARRLAQEALKLFEAVLAQQKPIMKDTSLSTYSRRTLEGDPVDLGRTHTLLAAIAITLGKSIEALTHLNTALAIFEQYDCQREIAIVCSNLGDIYLRRAEHSKAQASLRRSLNTAEQIGDIPSMSVDFGNLGVLAARLGDLAEAEAWYRRGLMLAEQINGPVYVSLLHSYLAAVTVDQGRLSEAGDLLSHALGIARVMKITPCSGFALVMLGNLRIAQAVSIEEDHSHSIAGTKRNDTRLQYLMRARASLRHALTLEGLEAETRTEGQLILAQVSLLLGELETAWQQATATLEEARRYELLWLVARSHRLLGDILAARGQQEQAIVYFTKALQVFNDSGMRLEHARALQSYGLTLIRSHRVGEAAYRQGLSSLQEAQHIFEECNAIIDLKGANLILSENPSPALTPSRRNNKKGS